LALILPSYFLGVPAGPRLGGRLLSLFARFNPRPAEGGGVIGCTMPWVSIGAYSKRFRRTRGFRSNAGEQGLAPYVAAGVACGVVCELAGTRSGTGQRPPRVLYGIGQCRFRWLCVPWLCLLWPSSVTREWGPCFRCDTLFMFVASICFWKDCDRPICPHRGILSRVRPSTRSLQWEFRPLPI